MRPTLFVRHQTVRLGLAVVAVQIALFLAFLPGRHDVLAPALTGMAQLVGTAGLFLLVPSGAVWWTRRRRPAPAGRICAWMSALGLAHSIEGERLLPIGTLYDPFIARGLDALNYACYQDARFIVVATPSGITLAPDVLRELNDATAPVKQKLGPNLDPWQTESRIR